MRTLGQELSGPGSLLPDSSRFNSQVKRIECEPSVESGSGTMKVLLQRFECCQHHFPAQTFYSQLSQMMLAEYNREKYLSYAGRNIFDSITWDPGRGCRYTNTRLIVLSAVRISKWSISLSITISE